MLATDIRLKPSTRRFSAILVAAWWLLAFAPSLLLSRAKGGDELLERGEAIYRAQCTSCHGSEGEGTEDAYTSPLVGDLSIGELASVISETMPEDDPEACVADDAAAVAAYIHNAFYSEAAQVRQRAARIGLARLTADQLRQSYADLYARFSGIASVTESRGIKGIYFDGARWKNENKKIERVDPVLDFDFGDAGPGEGIDPKAFYIHWSGGIKADVTGQYEIIVRSSCSFVMDFGSNDRELINNHVQSGDKTEFRRTVRLTAGRVYPFKIGFTQRERKTEQPPARISLSWIPPHGSEQIIPTRNLIDGHAPATFSLQTTLPPDDRSYGYERGIAINRQWDDSTTAAAIEFAAIASEELWPEYRRRHKKDSDENRAQLRGFLTELVETAFRGPLSDSLRALYIDQQVDATEDDAEAIKRVLLLSLKSPRFLYPTIDFDRSPSQRAANRLALVLYDSLPSDNWLIQQAKENRLSNEDQIRQAATRMVSDYRVQAKTREMLYQWLNLGHVEEVTKDANLYADFGPELVSDLRASLDAFLDEVVWSEASDYRQFFQADWTFTTDRLAAFYGDTWRPAEAEGPRLRRSVPDSERRMGVLSHPYLMSVLAYHDTTSPIHRGVFLTRHVLGRVIRPPSEAFSPLAPDLHPDLTTRQRVALQTSPDSCQACHTRINGLGFALENFDAVGRYRSSEREQPIDSSGSYITRSGELVEFETPRELADLLATHEDSHRAFVIRTFQHFVKQPPAAYGPETVERLVEKFQQSGFNIRELIVEIAVVAATHPLAPDDQDA
ncbi:DUF1588 domain-containing protein [Candidatus Laterigemmans baculatus]|uniref:DUF1588 domain-containing protein n=1 Tax=Candidatus Laterigemmans baculatus TaxID=2770505 RepID=UPI0013D93A06|nr:DUF1592 domain-containing protein [Candidatus Laterigemmans baculatus]